MLVLQRKCGERVVIDRNIQVTVLAIHGNRVKLGICGPPEVSILREELYTRMVSAAVATCGTVEENESRCVTATANWP